MTTNLLVYAGLNSNSLKKTLRSNASESKRLLRDMREHSITKLILGHALRENNLTKRITSLLSGERKKKGKIHLNNCKQIADI